MSRRLLAVLARRLGDSGRAFSTSGARLVLAPAFRLDQEWSARHDALKQLNLGGDYEWIAAVQKKFVGGGRATAVDVDAAVCLSEEADQLEDVISLIYKLRHTDNAADLLPSTEYALFRALLERNRVADFFQVINDPLNYGCFLNEHATALAIDHFLETGNIPAAAKIASVLMQQEMFDSPLLNALALYAVLRYAELPAEQRVFSDEIHKLTVITPEDDINEEEIRTMRFPYLKNAFFDDHFDIEEPDRLVGKTLEWLARELESRLAPQSVIAIRLLSLLFSSKVDEAAKLVDVLASGDGLQELTAAVAISRIEQLLALVPEDAKEGVEAQKLEALKEKLASCKTSEGSLSAELLAKVKELQPEGEAQLTSTQKTLFEAWNTQRKTHVRMQADRVNFRLRIEEIRAEMAALEARKEELFFFDNRVHWEDEAEQKDHLFEEFGLNKKDETVSEGEYAKTMFEHAREKKREQSGASH